MSQEMSLLDLSIRIIGLLILLVGSYLTYLSLKAELGVTNPRVFTPLGLVASLVGLLLLTARVR